jgi:hypothetical protein
MRYLEQENKTLALVKEVAHFRMYILNSRVIAYVPSSPVKMLLSQQLREGKWANWLAKIHKYDIEIKTLKDIKGQGLFNLIANSDFMDGMISISVGEPLDDSEWYKDIVFYLRFGKFHFTMNPKERRTLKMKENQYVLIAYILFRRNYDGILLRCVDENQAHKLMREFHEGICSGQFARISIAHKIIRVGFYHPSMFRDSYATIRKCVSCQ